MTTRIQPIERIHGGTIDIRREKLLTKAEAARMLAVGGRKPHPITLHRWMSRGVRGRKLASVLVGGIRVTSVEAVQRFLDEGDPQTLLRPAERASQIPQIGPERDAAQHLRNRPFDKLPSGLSLRVEDRVVSTVEPRNLRILPHESAKAFLRAVGLLA